MLVAGCGDEKRGFREKGPHSSKQRERGGRFGVKLTRVGSFTQPLHVTQPPGERELLFVVERTGRVRVVRDGHKLRRPFLDLRKRVSLDVEQGLLSLAFAPDYRRSGRFYVNFTDRAGNNRIEEYRRSERSPTVAAKASRRAVLFVRQPYPTHNVGLLLFGPDDLLYIGAGDGGPSGDLRNDGQTRRTLLGKILRIDPRARGERSPRKRSRRGRPKRKAYGTPRSNPFRGRNGRNEIYAYGLRNPWRFSFDRKTGDLWIGDVGQEHWEEVNYLPRGKGRGANFGWSAWEGNSRYKSNQHARHHHRPILAYSHQRGCSVTGGYVVRDRRLPKLYGRYVYGDFCFGLLRGFVEVKGRARKDRELDLKVPLLSSFGEDTRGRIYATSLEGPVFRLDPVSN